MGRDLVPPNIPPILPPKLGYNSLHLKGTSIFLVTISFWKLTFQIICLLNMNIFHYYSLNNHRSLK